MTFIRKYSLMLTKVKQTVLGHLKRAIEFNLERTGKHGLPCGLLADWNDCLELGHDGETVFVALQLRYALSIYSEICEIFEMEHEVEWAAGQLKVLDENIDKHGWDGEWYLRAFRFDGMKFGSHENDEGRVWLNPQSWSVLSGHASAEKAKAAMNAVKNNLATEYGVEVCSPPYENTDHKVIKAPLFNQGMKENASIFSHTQGWAVIAETMLGNGKQAYEYYRAYMPAAYNTKSEVRQIEPYVYCQFTHSRYSPRFGASRLPWLSGAATWSYYSATQYIIGIRPDYNGLIIDPCIPAEWKKFSITRRFRGNVLNIDIENTNGVEKGVKEISINGETITSKLIPVELIKMTNDVKVIMG